MRPQGAEGSPFYQPSHSIVGLYPQAVKTAIDVVTNPEYAEFHLFLAEHNITPAKLEPAIKFYTDYCDRILACTVFEEPFETFADIGIPVTDISFLIFQGFVAGALLYQYHSALVSYGSAEQQWRESYVKDLQKFIQEKWNVGNETPSPESVADGCAGK